MTGLSYVVFVLFNMSRMYYNALEWYIQYRLLDDGYVYMYMYSGTCTHVHIFQSSKTFFLICLSYELHRILSVDVDGLIIIVITLCHYSSISTSTMTTTSALGMTTMSSHCVHVSSCDSTF